MSGNQNPIKGTVEIPKFSFMSKKPAPEPGEAFVLYREGQKTVTLFPGDRMTAGEIKWGKYKKIYRVDVTEQRFQFECELPTSKIGYNFPAKVEVIYKINDPAEIVNRQIDDSHAALKPLLIDKMRVISRRYEPKSNTAAEEEITQNLRDQDFENGITISKFIIELNIESEIVDAIRAIGDQTHDATLTQMDREQDIKVKANQHDAQLKQLQLQNELALQQMQMQHYMTMIQGGMWNMLALQLSQNPNDVPKIIGEIRKEQKEEYNQQLLLLDKLIEKGDLEEYQINQAGKEVLTKLVGTMDTSQQEELASNIKDDEDFEGSNTAQRILNSIDEVEE